MKRLNLARTAAALNAFDEAQAAFNALSIQDLPPGRVEEEIRRLDTLAREVGVAFGLDTADRNDPETCARSVRPCLRNNPGGESFVRRAVRKWREETDQ